MHPHFDRTDRSGPASISRYPVDPVSFSMETVTHVNAKPVELILETYAKVAYLDIADTPAGPIRFAVDQRGTLLRSAFRDGSYACTLEEDLERDGFVLDEDARSTARGRQAILDYTTGAARGFDLPLALTGSEWQVSVWRALTSIPFGETCTYAQLAVRAGRPGAARAAGRANATNKLPLIVPCHRVIGSDGSLTGFGGGIHLKARLLEHEARVLAGERP